MRITPVQRRAAAELLGTMILVTAVVGSGIMATLLTDDVGVQLLMNMLATVLVLGLLIWTLGPICGAHFTPAVTGVALVRREIHPRQGGGGLHPRADRRRAHPHRERPPGAVLVPAWIGAAIGAVRTELFHPRVGVTPEPLDLPGPVHDDQPPQ